MSKRTLFLIFALFVVTSVLLIMALYKPNLNPQPIPIAPTPKEETAQTVLMFGDLSTAASSSAAILNYSLPIKITTGKNKINAIQLEMQYDPLIITNVTVVPSSFFKNPQILLDKTDIKTGRISYAFGVGLTDEAAVGNGVIADLNFSAKAPLSGVKPGIPQQTTIMFLPKTFVIGEGITQSVLKQALPIQITVGKP